MPNKSKLFILITMTFLCLFTSLKSAERISINGYELNDKDNFYYIHIGKNIWLHATEVHQDAKGLYALDKDILRTRESTSQKTIYVTYWKCPYCYSYCANGKK